MLISSVQRLTRLSRFRNAYLVRGLAVWGGLRLALAVGGVTHPGPLGRTMTVLLAATVVLLDAERRDEDVFLGNLGVSRGAIVLMAMPLAVLLEGLLP